MPKKSKKKPFIDKNASVSFRLVHRSQQDPLIASEGGEHVLAPEASVTSRQDRKETEQKFGLYYDDDYDYLQHLRDANEVQSWEPIEARYRIEPNGRIIEAGTDLATVAEDGDAASSALKLPSRLFETAGVELNVGLLNQAAPQPGPHPEWDPDIVAALDDDFDWQDEDGRLDDDFVLQANAPGDTEFREQASDSDDSQSGYDASDQSSDGDFDEFGHEETRSRFTNYSVSSSVMRRTEGLQKVDAMFEKIYEQYDEEEIGDLEMEDEEALGGFIEPQSDRIHSLMDKFYADREAQKNLVKNVMSEKGEQMVLETKDNDDDEEIVVPEESSKGKERWDCESIISTYSTLYNHPTLIKEPSKKQIRLNKRTGVPLGVLHSEGGITQKMLKILPDDGNTDKMEIDESVTSRASTVRPKTETPEDRRIRKRAVRLERKERRMEKKANKLAFVKEAAEQSRQQINATHGLKLV